MRRRTLQQQRTDFFELLFADVAGVTVSHHDIFTSIGKIVNTRLGEAFFQTGELLVQDLVQICHRAEYVAAKSDAQHSIFDSPVLAGFSGQAFE